MRTLFGVPIWSLGAPLTAFFTLVAVWGRPLGAGSIPLIMAALIAAVIAAVHHAEVIAHRVGEPFGTLILALSVTVIEVALIVTLMLSGGTAANALARDTVFATVMIVCNGIVGLCLLVGAIRHRVLVFQVDGTGPPLSVLAALTTLTLIVPTLTITTPGPTLSPAQLVFAGVMSLALYSVFVFVQTVRHRDYFLPVVVDSEEQHASPPSTPVALSSLGFLLISLCAVIGLAKMLSPSIQVGVQSASAPAAVVGIAIALLVLLPEAWAALRAATLNRMQTSLNLALGSALATIGLTIPAVAAVSIAFDMPLELGLAPKETALLALTLLISTITLANGRATVLHGTVHLVVFAAFIFLAVVP